MAAPALFEPSRHLSKVNGSDYLEVKWRLVWLREQHPDARIETDLVSLDRTMAVFKATVTVPGGGTATGWGSEGPDDFRDYIEKAETKALGRALAALGFGTQFCPDFDFGAANGRVVDAPIDFNATRGRRLAAVTPAAADRPDPTPAATANPAPTQRQIRYLQAVGREAGLSDEEIEQEAIGRFGTGLKEISRRDASILIEHLQARRQPVDIAS
ncbi:MAG: hypothetical protein ACKOWF_08320 [Chloroflexota bacterium]